MNVRAVRRGVLAAGALLGIAALTGCSPEVIGHVALSVDGDGRVVAVGALCEGTLTDVEFGSADDHGQIAVFPGEQPFAWAGEVVDRGVFVLPMTPAEWPIEPTESYGVHAWGRSEGGLLGEEQGTLWDSGEIPGATLRAIPTGHVLEWDAESARHVLLTFEEFGDLWCPDD